VAVLGAALTAAVLTAGAVPAGASAATAPIGQEQVESVTETSTTVVRPDGQRVLTLYTGAVRMQRGAEWVPVDLTLVTGPDGVVRPAAAAHDIALTPTGPVVRFAGGGSAALDWTAPLPAPRLEGHRAVYPQAQPGHDLVVEATRSGFVASLRLTTPGAPAVPGLVLRSRAPGGGIESVPGTGGAEAGATTDSAVSRVVAAAPPPPGPAPAPFDTTVRTTVARTDLSGDPELRIGTYDGAAVARSYLTWDLTPIAGRPVTSATLRVHQNWSASCRPRGWEVWSAPAAGGGTRWANQPVADLLRASSTETRGHTACAAGWAGVDVTELVRTWTSTGSPAGSVQLRASDEGDPLGWKRIGAAESADPPHLEITLG
jgi:hypothetical protein